MTDINNLDVIILIIVGISGLIALSRGLIKEVLSIVGWVLSACAVVWLLPFFTKITNQYVDSGLISGIISAIFILILFMIIWTITTDNMVGKIRSSKLSGLDRVLGLFFGIMRAFLLVILINILVSWCITESHQPEFLQKSKYFKIAGNFAKPIEDLIPQETLDVIKKKTDKYIAEKEQKSENKTIQENKKKQESEELFNRLAQPQIKKKSSDKKQSLTNSEIKEEFSGYNSKERENLERLIDMVD